ncbi:IclR family transcriptional regulator [Paraburkholderia tropica]|uniref:IclR family transcriptional regulator n=1 Tax=Paraburkholderia tropica TaxID=92647 RepID=UPI001CB1D42D|nr:IclR family transcriptional regulator [Paraburkholderia tropica]CAG9199954.1 IclR family transcriptional regulator [Paraburkholderia tropica]
MTQAAQNQTIHPQAAQTSEDRYALRSVSRALDVLEALGACGSEGLTVAEIATVIGVSKSTAFALLQTLLARSYVIDVRLGGSRRYRLGFALVHLGDRAAADIGVSQLAMPVLRELTEATGLTSRLAVLDDEGYAVAIARMEAPGIVRIASALGQRELPHCSALGKSLMALLPPARVVKLLAQTGMPKRTQFTRTTPAEFMRDLMLVAERGYAFDDEEDNIGVVCVGSAITNRDGEGVAAISVTTLKTGLSEDDLHALGGTLRMYAERISGMLGAQVQPLAAARA